MTVLIHEGSLGGAHMIEWYGILQYKMLSSLLTTLMFGYMRLVCDF